MVDGDGRLLPAGYLPSCPVCNGGYSVSAVTELPRQMGKGVLTKYIEKKCVLLVGKVATHIVMK